MEMPGTGISEFRGNIELVAQRNLRRTSHFIFWLDDDTIAQASTCLWHSWDYKVMFCGGFIYSHRVFSF